MIHICFHKEIISHFHKYCPNDKVVYFPLKLSIGNIPRINYTEGINIYHMKKDNIKKELDYFYQMIQKDDIYTIWYSHESDEYCGFIYVLFELLKYSNKIILYNCSQKIVRLSSKIIYDSSSEITDDVFLWIMNHPQSINDLDYFSSLYHQLFDQRFNIRLYHHDLQFTTINDIEKLIVSYLKKESLSLNVLKMKFIVDEEIYISDYIIDFIVNHMLKQEIIHEKDGILFYL